MKADDLRKCEKQRHGNWTNVESKEKEIDEKDRDEGSIRKSRREGTISMKPGKKVGVAKSVSVFLFCSFSLLAAFISFRPF